MELPHAGDRQESSSTVVLIVLAGFIYASMAVDQMLVLDVVGTAVVVLVTALHFLNTIIMRHAAMAAL